MRGFPGRGLPCLVVLPLLFLVIIQGCAGPILQIHPASEQEIESVSEAFTRFQKISEEECGGCFDAEADAALSVSGWFSNHTGKFSGYLQAMKPGYIKFIAINPLGQPLFIFVTNGDTYKSLNVFAEKAYSGSVHSKAYSRFAPPGFEARFSYYWLTGRLQPGEIRIQAVMRHKEQGKFWLQIKHANSSTDSMILFDSEELKILRHVIRDERGGHLADILYEDHGLLPGRETRISEKKPAAISGLTAGKERCKLPARITVSFNEDAEKIEVRLYSFLDDARFSAEDFNLRIPANFEQLPVK